MLDRTARSIPELRPWWGSSRARDIYLNVAVAAGYWLIAELTLLPATSAGRVTPMWPASGLAVSALLLGGTRLLPGIALGSFITMVLRVPIPAAIVVAIGAALEATIAVTLLRRFKFDDRLERVRDPLILTLVAMIGAAASATVGVLATFFSGEFSASQLLTGGRCGGCATGSAFRLAWPW